MEDSEKYEPAEEHLPSWLFGCISGAPPVSTQFDLHSRPTDPRQLCPEVLGLLCSPVLCGTCAALYSCRQRRQGLQTAWRHGILLNWFRDFHWRQDGECSIRGWRSIAATVHKRWSWSFPMLDHDRLLTLWLPRVINFKFPLQPHQKYYITPSMKNLAFHSLLI